MEYTSQSSRNWVSSLDAVYFYTQDTKILEVKQQETFKDVKLREEEFKESEKIPNEA